MNIELEYTGELKSVSVNLPLSKSECNRLLVAQFLSGNSFEIEEISDADDSQILKKCLQTINTESHFDVHHAGTAFRFLTAVFAITEGTRVLTGSNRLKERPISPLVNALRSLGAEIEYLENENYAPLKITGKKLNGGNVLTEAGISSQFVSALMLIAPYLENGLHIILVNKPVSFSYILLTASVIEKLGVAVTVGEEEIVVKQGNYFSDTIIKAECDWTAASYWYQIVAMSEQGLKITLPNLYENSFQGDVMLKDLFTFFGVHTAFKLNEIVISKNGNPVKQFAFDFTDQPDLAQTIAVTAVTNKVGIILNGVSTLHNKETDRVEALKNELSKIDVELIKDDTTSFKIEAQNLIFKDNLFFSTYNDHRMAMCLAPLVLHYKKITIENADVVSKSYPNFWEHLKTVGINVTKLQL